MTDELEIITGRMQDMINHFDGLSIPMPVYTRQDEARDLQTLARRILGLEKVLKDHILRHEAADAKAMTSAVPTGVAVS